MATATTPEPKKKSRLSRLLKGRRDGDVHSYEGNSGTSGNSFHDSAYASSEGAPSTSDITPYHNTGQIPGVSADRNLILDKWTGEVVDEESGDVVTTITTTTTTTTTTTSKGGKKVDVQTHAGQPQQSTSYGQHSMGQQQQPGGQYLANEASAVPPVELAANPSSQPLSLDGPPGVPSSSPAYPAVPARHPDRNLGTVSSGNHEPVSPIVPETPNFSYPARNEERKHGGAFSNLKAAVVGIHGVGETLRGTLNDSVDRHVPGGNAEARAAAQAKNNAVLDRGRNEMGGLQHRTRD